MGEIEICYGGSGSGVGAWARTKREGWDLSAFDHGFAIFGVAPADAPSAQSDMRTPGDADRAAAIAAICGVEVSAQEIRDVWAACMLRLEAAKEAA